MKGQGININKKVDIFYITKRKVIFTSISILMLCLCIFAFIINETYNANIFKRIDKELIKEQGAIEKIISSLPNSIKDKNNPLPPAMNPGVLAIVYYNDMLEVVKSNTYFDETNLPNLKTIVGSDPVNIESGGYRFRVCYIKKNNLKVYLLINIDSELKSIQQLKESLLISFIILFLVALGLSYYLSARIIKPVKEAYDKQVFFVQDASHEMRTPLAIIKGKIELLTKSIDNISDNELNHISKIMSEIRRLEKMNSDLLLLSKEDIDQNSILQEFYLDDIVKDIGGFYNDIAEVINRNFSVNSNINTKVIWDYDKVKRIFVILIENAFKYTNKNGDIIISFKDSNKNIEVSVKDNGIGIKKEDQERIFDRFFRTNDVRGKNIDGSGIGLSVLKSICKTLRIEVTLNSEFGKGSEFILLIPKVMR